MTLETTTTEHAWRTGAPPNDGPVGGPPGPSAEIDRSEPPARDAGDVPTGLPEGAPEGAPPGTAEEPPADPPRGPDHMPGIPTGGEPPSAG